MEVRRPWIVKNARLGNTERNPICVPPAVQEKHPTVEAVLAQTVKPVQRVFMRQILTIAHTVPLDTFPLVIHLNVQFVIRESISTELERLTVSFVGKVDFKTR